MTMTVTKTIEVQDLINTISDEEIIELILSDGPMCNLDCFGGPPTVRFSIQSASNILTVPLVDLVQESIADLANEGDELERIRDGLKACLAAVESAITAQGDDGSTA